MSIAIVTRTLTDHQPADRQLRPLYICDNRSCRMCQLIGTHPKQRGLDSLIWVPNGPLLMYYWCGTPTTFQSFCHVHAAPASLGAVSSASARSLPRGRFLQIE